MTTTLAALADVQLGYQHRGKVMHSERGSHRLIQGKDIVRGGSVTNRATEPAGWFVSTGDLGSINTKGDADRYRLQPGDVLFVSRGTNNIAVPLVEGVIRPFPVDWGDLIAAYTFYILRPDQHRVLPEFLAWYINQQPAQSYLSRQARGSLVKLVPKSLFEQLPMPAPPLRLQHQIVALEQLRTNEESLLLRLVAARRQQVGRACLDAITPPNEDLT